MSTNNAMMKESWTLPNMALAACTLLMLLTSASTLITSHGDNQSTALMIFSTLSMVGIAVLHSVRHLGIKSALMYFGIIVVIELIFEQVNIWSAGKVFGELTYPDNYFGPKILDIPIAVPLAMCAINWPTYVLARVFKLPAEKPFSPILESAPLVMYGGIALLLLMNPVNQALAIGTIFTMLAYVSLGFFRLWQKNI
ncbi:MAG TPA: hypothetical protein PKH01_07455 [Pseudomonadales bacterium]|nr:hypothetical protein [Pseudomonadales bacterium]